MSKEKRPTQTPSKDPEIRFDRIDFFQNTLSLPQALKDRLASEGLDYRFINAAQFRLRGNRHHRYWQPYVIQNPQEIGLTPNAEGLLQVGDLILGVRAKKISQQHREFVKERTRRLSGQSYNKEKAKELRAMARAANADGDIEVLEGYEDSPEVARRGTYKSE